MQFPKLEEQAIVTNPNLAYIKHFANPGDAIASMASIKTCYEQFGKKIVFCQQLDVKASYYDTATHPTVDKENKMVMMNKKIWEMLRPLILSQEYIEDAQVYNGQKIDIDFDIIRGKIFINMPNQALQQWLFLAYPNLARDLSKPWMVIDESKVDISSCKLVSPKFPLKEFELGDLSNKIIINFTERYRNEAISYFFLKKFADRVIFSGTEREYNMFCERWELEIPLLIVEDFLQLAAILKKSKFFLGNQSFLWNICEAQKIPRIVELCQYAPNCQPFIGEDTYGYYYQSALEYYFKTLLEKK